MELNLNNKSLPDFDSIKDDNEQILWTDKPKFIPFAISALSVGVGITIFFAVCYQLTKSIKSFNDSTGVYSFWIAALPLVLFLFSFLIKIFSYTNTGYAFSNRRIMIRSGFLRTSIKIIDYDKISDIQVSVNLIERAFKVGTIKFFSGHTESNEGVTNKLYDRWEAIANPYDVFKELKKITVDIKTDFNFPNAFRPETNPGYRTKYDPSK